MTRQPSDDEIWAELQQMRRLISADPQDHALVAAVEVCARAAVCHRLSVEPERVRNVIAMRATSIGF